MSWMRGSWREDRYLPIPPFKTADSRECSVENRRRTGWGASSLTTAGTKRGRWQQQWATSQSAVSRETQRKEPLRVPPTLS